MSATSGFTKVVLLASGLELDEAIGTDACGSRGVAKAGSTLSGGAMSAVGEGKGMRVTPGVGVICWTGEGQVEEGADASEGRGGDKAASEDRDSKTSCTDGKSEGFGSLSPKAQKILV